MGWTYPFGASRKSLIEDRTQAWERESAGMTVKTTCLAHCFRGGRFSGVLWAVWEQTHSQGKQPTRRWITCDLIRCHSGEWGYKDMSEACSPFYYSCPLKYLDLVSIEQHGGNAEWRKQVHQHHTRQKEKRQRKRSHCAS
ncbi:hypothetical protein CA54_41140 [Symmachiella macrocystis]|uniref:Uncharacterized protein n=1 Tax=Symmachiella macrocystis TaxID=2527985 RepID=A0A5C6B9C3_9PLAN|nr:hypothetical protein CA54_41140 [Symmachiella macrocystis]